MAATRRTAPKPAPEPEIVDDEFEEMDEVEELDEADELEEVDETPVPEKKTSKRSTAAANAAREAAAPQFGSAWLAEHITSVTGETFDSRGIRMLLRKLAADKVLNRQVGETRERYSFAGPEDPIVKQVVTMVKTGEAKKLKQAGLDKVKATAAERKAAKKAAEAEVESEEMDEVEEETPAPKPRRTAAKATTTPAKAAPSTRRKAPAAS